MQPSLQSDRHFQLFRDVYLACSDEKQKLKIFLEDYLQNKKIHSFLDVGAGSGEITAVVAKKAKEVTCVEMLEDLCAAIKQKIPHAKVFNGSIDEALFSESTFDFILCSHVLYYIPLNRWNEILTKIFSWAKPKGQVMIILNSVDSDWYRFSKELSSLLNVAPNFFYLAPEEWFPHFLGGPKQILSYSSQLCCEASHPQLAHFLVECQLGFPDNFISKNQWLQVEQFIQSKKDRSGKYIDRDKILVGVWEKK